VRPLAQFATVHDTGGIARLDSQGHSLLEKPDSPAIGVIFMRRFPVYAIALLFSVGASHCGFAEQPSIERANTSSDKGWIPLFDGKSLNGFYPCLDKQKKNEDPAKIFQALDGVIHVYKDQTAGVAVPYGYLATESEYAYYHLRLEYKWGNKKFRPRAEQRRDAGVLYHMLPPDVVWPRCIECQIQEKDVGDCFTVRGTQVVASVETVNIETPSGPKMLPRYKPDAEGGSPRKIGEGSIARIVKSSTHEHEGWNTVEVIVRGSNGIVHIVNGHTVFQAKDLRQLSADKNWEPLAHGRIALQAEFAEVFYRNIEIRPIPEGPLYPTAVR
jgi:Domain of Unknown Function (DUF1080)